jgi:cytochrome c-type protein NapC
MANGSQGLDYWQARLRADGSLQVVDGQVLDKRQALTDGTISATAERQGETWVVTFTRPRASTNGRLSLAQGRTYMIGFALHAGHAAKRFHYVSFDQTLALGSAADFSVSLP